ncbi:MAG: methyltransferase domain-containing protein, partial [Tepidisphaeraceae bacterium]
EVVVGSRYMQRDSLPGWNILRRSLTMLGHALTKYLLQMPQDATGALRVYNLRRIPRGQFLAVMSKGYSFFFESLFLLVQNGYSIKEVPIVLPARTYGHSKMSYKEAIKSARQLFALYMAKLSNPLRFKYVESIAEIDPSLVDKQGWDAYWSAKHQTSTFVYEVVAAIYRKAILKGVLRRAIRKTFVPGAALLHAGCGSGQVDAELHDHYQITALDISPPALVLYQRHNPKARFIKHGSILTLPMPDSFFDGVYNLGVMEHFLEDEIVRIFREFARVLRDGGKVLLFWPHTLAPSVIVLGTIHRILNFKKKEKVQLHPPEVCLVRGRKQVEALLNRAGLRLLSYRLTFADGFIQAQITAEKDR